MPNIFEELMAQNRNLTEGVKPKKKVSRQVKESAVKKIPVKKIKLESRRVFESEDIEDLDNQFAVDPENSNDDEVVLVIDPEVPADEVVPEDAAEQMIGDEVYKCPICGANYVCNCESCQNEGIEVDENGVPSECPICGDDAEQILVGEIAPTENAGEPDELDPVGPDDGEDEESEEDLENDEPLDDSVEEQCGSSVKKESRRIPYRGRRKVSEDVCPDCGEVDCVCDLDDSPLELIDADPATVDTDDEGDDFAQVKIDTDVVNLNLDDTRFESMMTKMIRENYKFNPSFKITKAVHRTGADQLRLEYVIREKGKKPCKGVLVAEGFSGKSRKMTLKFKDKGAFTESFTKTPSFIVECVRVRNNVIPTSMKYDFKKRVNESVYRVYGSVDSRNQ